ncbi:methyltransferase domain-containing protein, partial [Patescibacteria group bacterium]|nr:methyltransferase domain-containing protein [Patescibacteria group bacterium]
MKQNTSWGSVAEWYAKHLEDKDSYHSQVVLPNILRVLDIQKGQQVLDLACGTGFFSEAFHAAGAQVIGVDIGKELIDTAREHTSKDITFIVSKAHELKDIKNKSIDKIAIILAIQNIKEVKDVFVEARRVLKQGCSLVVVMNHPMFRIPGGSSWEWSQDKEYRRIDYYLSEKSSEIIMHPGRDIREVTVSFHRPLQYYVKLARNAGFNIIRIEEWISHKSSEKGPRQKEEDRLRKEIP